MRENYTNIKCASCAAGKPKIRLNKKAGFFTSFLLVILPKCPLCVIAYSSTIMLCGKEESIISSQIHSSLLATVITILLCLVILASLFLNYRDNRSKYSLILAFIGTVLLVASTIWDIGPVMYYAGTAIIFMGVWLNGSMLYLLNKVKAMILKLEALRVHSFSET
jgi:amino acid transporter